jgi:hypothetical protein
MGVMTSTVDSHNAKPIKSDMDWDKGLCLKL